MPLVGRSASMQEVYRVLARLMQTDLTVMINGDSGTGKELVARALHDFGRRRKGPFVAVNMAAIPRDLIELELFGHEKGAFTGALARSVGRFEQAEGGTLFLDEIGDMPMEAQTRLLRVLQQGEYTTVGGRVPIKTNVRIIAATNKQLRGLIQQGLFREDLFFRLNVVPIRLPPLRERSEDIPDLLRHFFAVNEKEGLPTKTLEPEAIELLCAYRWPGNVRELENLVRRLAALYAQDTSRPRSSRRARQSDAARRADGRGFGRAVRGGRTVSAAAILRFGPQMPPGGLYHRIVEDRTALDQRGACRDPRQSDQGGAAPGTQSQHFAQKNQRSRHSGDQDAGVLAENFFRFRPGLAQAPRFWGARQTHHFAPQSLKRHIVILLHHKRVSVPHCRRRDLGRVGERFE